MNEMEALHRRVEDLLREAEKAEKRQRTRQRSRLSVTMGLPEWRYSVGYLDGLRKVLAEFPNVKPRGAR